MKFVIAPDSFKGSLTAKEAAEDIRTGLARVYPDATYELVPMADGGEGTVQSLVDATDGELITETVTGPLGKPVQAAYGMLGDGETAAIEMSAASGIGFVTDETKNPLVTTTYGTGELIIKALDRGAKRLFWVSAVLPPMMVGLGWLKQSGCHSRMQRTKNSVLVVANSAIC